MEKEKINRPFIWLFLKMRPVLRWAIHLRSSPKGIAGGFALGIFLAFTPTIGFQIVLAVILAAMLNLNQPAAIVGACVTNPLTIPVIFTFNYWLGSLIWPGPSVSAVSRHLIELTAQITKLDIWDITDQLAAVIQLGPDIIAPLLVGSLIAGILSAGLSYVVLLRLLEAFFARRARRKKSKSKIGTL
jgi:uncharacterized protein (DUF2062 family)